MTTKIFYFSATGNSLSVARKISNIVRNVELISISSAKQKCIIQKVERIGFVFPIYAYGLPRIVEEFVTNMQITKTDYAFVVATCAGTPGNAVIQLANLLQKRNITLNAGFVVKESNHTFLAGNVFMQLMMKISGEQPLPTKDRLSEITTAINNKQDHELETSLPLANFIGGVIHKLATKSFMTADRAFWTNEKCTSCRTCEKICPRGNISLLDNKLIWHHNCELCFSCVQWCPNQAIEYQNTSVGKTRTHHQDIELNDIVN